MKIIHSFALETIKDVSESSQMHISQTPQSLHMKHDISYFDKKLKHLSSKLESYFVNGGLSVWKERIPKSFIIDNAHYTLSLIIDLCERLMEEVFRLRNITVEYNDKKSDEQIKGNAKDVKFNPQRKINDEVLKRIYKENTIAKKLSIYDLPMQMMNKTLITTI